MAASIATTVAAAYNTASRAFLHRNFEVCIAETTHAVAQLPEPDSVWSNESHLDATAATLAQYRRKFAILLSSLFSVAWTSEGNSVNFPSSPAPPPALQPLAALSGKSCILKSYHALRTSQIRLLSRPGHEHPSVLPPSVMLALTLAGKQLGQSVDAQAFFKQWYQDLDDDAKALLRSSAHTASDGPRQNQPPAISDLTDSRMLPQADTEVAKQCQCFDKLLHLYSTTLAVAADKPQVVDHWIEDLRLDRGGVLSDERVEMYKQQTADAVKRLQEAASTRETRQLELLEEMRAQNEHYKRVTAAPQFPKAYRQPSQRPAGRSSSTSGPSSDSSSGDSSLDSQTAGHQTEQYSRIHVSSEEDDDDGEEHIETKRHTPSQPPQLTGFKAFRSALSNFVSERTLSPGERPPPSIREVLRANLNHWLTHTLGVHPTYFFAGSGVLLLCFALLRARYRRRVRAVLVDGLTKLVATVKMGTQARYL